MIPNLLIIQKEKIQLKDSQFADDLVEKYLSEVFSWMVKGAIEYYKDKRINATNEFQRRTNETIEDGDSITSFLKYRVKFTKDVKDKVAPVDMFKIYQKYCQDTSKQCKPRTTLYNRLEHLKVVKKIYNGYPSFHYIKIIHEDDEEENNDEDIKEKEKQDEEEEERILLKIEREMVLLNQLFKANEEKKALNREKNKDLREMIFNSFYKDQEDKQKQEETVEYVSSGPNYILEYLCDDNVPALIQPKRNKKQKFTTYFKETETPVKTVSREEFLDGFD